MNKSQRASWLRWTPEAVLWKAAYVDPMLCFCFSPLVLGRVTDVRAFINRTTEPRKRLWGGADPTFRADADGGRASQAAQG